MSGTVARHGTGPVRRARAAPVAEKGRMVELDFGFTNALQGPFSATRQNQTKYQYSFILAAVILTQIYTTN